MLKEKLMDRKSEGRDRKQNKGGRWQATMDMEIHVNEADLRRMDLFKPFFARTTDQLL